MLEHLIAWFMHPTVNRVIILLLTLLGAAGSVLWPAAMLATIMMFAAPNSGRHIGPWLLLVGIFLWPWFYVAGVVGAFILLAHDAVAWAYVSVSTPLVPVAVLVGILAKSRWKLRKVLITDTESQVND